MSALDNFAAFCGALVLESGERMVLEDWQRAVLADYFEGCPETLIVSAKKSGKSTLLAALALHHLLTTPDADAVVVAASREQAALITEQIAGFVRRSPGCAKRVHALGNARELRGIGKYAGRRIKVLPADPRTADGVRPTFVAVDELHRHPTSELYSVLRDGLVARGGRLLAISTAGEFETPDEDDPHADPLARLRLSARELPLSMPTSDWRYVTARSERFAYHEFALWDGDDPHDFETVKMANPQSWETVETLRSRYESRSMQEWQWLRFTCGRWVSGGEDCAISTVDWAACADLEAHIPRGAHVFVGLDCARVRDTTAIVPVWSPDLERVVTCDAVVMRPPGDGSQIPVSRIVPTIVDMAQRWSVTVVFDPAAAGGLVAEELDRLGVDTIEFAQSPAQLAEASERLRGLVVERRLTHDGNPIVTSHVLAAVQRSVGAEGWRLAKPRRGGRHVDAAQALSWAALMALDGPQPFTPAEIEQMGGVAQ